MTFDDLYQKELNRNQAQAQAQTQAQNQASNHTEELELSPAEFIQTFQYRLDDLIVKSKYLLDNGISALNRNFILTDDEDEDEDDVEEEEEEEEEEEDEDESKLEKGVVKSKVNEITEIEQTTRLSLTSTSSFTRPISIKNKNKSSSIILKFLKNRRNSTKRNSSCNTTNPRHESQTKAQRATWSQFKKIIKLYCALNPIPIPTQSKTKPKKSHNYLNLLRFHFFKI